MRHIKVAFQAILYFRNLGYTTQRWGAFQFLISAALFLFGAALAIRLAYVGGGPVSTGFAVFLFVLGLCVFAFAMYIGLRFVTTGSRDVLDPPATRSDLLAIRDSIDRLITAVEELPEAIAKRLRQEGEKHASDS